MKFHRIGIYGLGLLGASLALTIKDVYKPKKIIGFARKQKVLNQAIAQGMIDEGYVSLENHEAIQSCDLLILCVPIRSIMSALKILEKICHKNLVVVDVGSTKEQIVKTADQVLRKSPVSFVGCHPMAGSDKSGLIHAQRDLFERALCLVCPGKTSSKKVTHEVEVFWRKLNCRVEIINAKDHDKIIARVSHFPHLVSAALVQSVNESQVKYAGAGFKDMTRIAASNTELWKEILFSNIHAVKKAHEEFERKLKSLISLLGKHDEKKFSKIIHKASERRKKIDKM